jgi:predicted nuclease of predicted toxin-antitoxin system
MRILLDENVDWRLVRGLLGHEVESVQRLGWAGIQNGVLLKKAEEAGFELLITTDSNMTFQLNLAGRRLKIVVLRASSNRLADRSADAKNLADSAQPRSPAGPSCKAVPAAGPGAVNR